MTKSVIRIRVDRLDVARRVAGYDSNRALAQAMGMSHSTVGRALSGESAIGSELIAGLLRAFPGLAFEDLFTVEETDDEEADEPELARVG